MRTNGNGLGCQLLGHNILKLVLYESFAAVMRLIRDVDFGGLVLRGYFLIEVFKVTEGVVEYVLPEFGLTIIQDLVIILHSL